MEIKKRTLPMYIFLNCITLGIYGFVVARQMNSEINNLCNGDDQEPGVGYAAAAFIRLIPVFGPIYFNYWWYQQANRLKLNANRLRITVKESGTDIFLMRTVLEIPLIFITILELGVSLIIPSIIVILVSFIHPILGFIFGAVFCLIIIIFSGELTIGANISNYYVMKNLNRFADTDVNNPAPFDPMAYEYYPSAESKYPNFLPGMIKHPDSSTIIDDDGYTPPPPPPPPVQGMLMGVKGSCSGYNFDLHPGEEIIIGKDAKVSSVVIDPAYKEISRKHVGVSYDAIRNQYRVVDYSSNGTWANGSKLESNKEVYLSRGSELKLANGKNVFRLN